MNLHGKNVIASDPRGAGSRTFAAINPATGARLDPAYHEATNDEIDAAMRSAAEAFPTCRRKTPEQIAAFLDRIAQEITDLGDDLITRANDETALGIPRLTGERGRTVGQLKTFAALVRDGSWVEASIDTAQPQRQPLPKPDLRRMLIPIGPVVVFAASNFPLAFSVAGGDTASALAAGNPVVVKAHPAHPGTSELVARAIAKAAQSCDMPPGVFSLIHGTSPDVSLALVRHAAAKAAGFTGSLQAGRAIFDAASSRPDPIPVHAEMGSTNPVFILPAALAERSDKIAEGLAQSVTLGAGQFCTNPGLVFGLNDERLKPFIDAVAARITQSAPATMLYKGILDRYQQGVQEFQQTTGVRVAGKSSSSPDTTKTQAPATVFVVDGETFARNHRLHEELFGPATLVVSCDDAQKLESIAASLPGQLTATIHGTEADLARFGRLVRILEEKAGRLIFNGFPTGVEVCPSMQHGGPYPATTDVRFTSVGTQAIKRFARPVCYQSWPQAQLPPELQDANPRKIWRLVDGSMAQ